MICLSFSKICLSFFGLEFFSKCPKTACLILLIWVFILLFQTADTLQIKGLGEKYSESVNSYMPAATGGGGGGSTGGSSTSQDRHPGAGNLNREDSSATGNKD